MSETDPHRLGYRQVDDDPHVAVLVANMDATSAWDATKELRRWERDQLGLRAGERLLDVGCGTGGAALALAGALGPTGEVVGVDASAEMLAVARRRTASSPCPTRFEVGNALALDEPDASFDAARSERTLQWVSDPAAAVGELARVVRPGGRVTLLDADWSTLRLDVGDEHLAAIVRGAMAVERNRPSAVGSRLAGLAAAAGLGDIASTTATKVWRAWDPDLSPTPDGCFSMASLVADLAESGQPLHGRDPHELVATIEDAARRGRFWMSLTMFAVRATR